jgi:hypothetical protein
MNDKIKTEKNITQADLVSKEYRKSSDPERNLSYEERVDWVALSRTLEDPIDQHVMQMEGDKSPKILLDKVEDAKKAQIEKLKREDAEAREAEKNSKN